MLLKPSDHWRSPPAVVELARSILGDLDLDPAANRSDRHWFAGENWTRRGLDQPWEGRVYLNPPYSQLRVWVPYASQQRDAVVIALIPPAVGTEYWHEYIWRPHRNGHAQPWADAIAFPRGRFAFVDGRGRTRGGNRYESAFVLWCGGNRALIRAFRRTLEPSCRVVVQHD